MFSHLFKMKPNGCLLCHESGDEVCQNCMADLKTGLNQVEMVCPKCASVSIGGSICGRCQKTPPAFDYLWASIRYEMPITGVLHEWKHLGKSEYIAVFSKIMTANSPHWLESDMCLLAMPLSRERRLYRGFNQCDDLSERLAKHFGLTVLSHHTVERLHRPPQSTLGAEERRKNVRKIFQVRQTVQNCKIVLIDDVVTTGATLSELAQTLKKAGAAQVNVWVAASNKMQKI